MKTPKYLIGQYLRHPMDTWPPYKVIAYASGYYMMRRKGCMPCVFSEKEIDKTMKPFIPLTKDL